MRKKREPRNDKKYKISLLSSYSAKPKDEKLSRTCGGENGEGKWRKIESGKKMKTDGFGWLPRKRRNQSYIKRRGGGRVQNTPNPRPIEIMASVVSSGAVRFEILQGIHSCLFFYYYYRPSTILLIFTYFKTFYLEIFKEK